MVLYEADEDALERMENYSKEHYGQYYILPHCLDSTISSKSFNINRDPLIKAWGENIINQRLKFVGQHKGK